MTFREKPAIDRSTIGRNYSWRGWFNGKEDRDNNSTAPNETDLSDFRARTNRDAYVSQPVWRVADRGFVVTQISCPIVSSDTNEPIGV